MPSEMSVRHTVQQRKFAFRTSPNRGCVNFQRFILPLIFPFVLIALSTQATAQAQPQPMVAQTTLAIFPTGPHDKSISDQLWPVLVAALYQELTAVAPEMSARMTVSNPLAASIDSSTGVQILRGDRIVSGLAVGNPITIFLHGDCTTNPAARLPINKLMPVSDALGWVQLRQGRIQPFIHVECDRLAQLLHVPAVNRNQNESNRLMAVAIARVILHEWIHIAFQNPHHARSGISKAEFTAADLLIHPAKPAPSLAAQTRAANDCGVALPPRDGDPHSSALMQGGK